MKYVLLCAGMAAGSLLAGTAPGATASVTVSQAASRAGLAPTARDRAICDPIFSRLDRAEHGTLLAQAEAPKQSEPPTAGQAEEADKPDEGKLATELTAMLQACSYDGRAIKVDASAMRAATDVDGTAVVGQIMRYTGLPQNFTIMESEVPNAAAIIVMGADGVPKRVIAYSRKFMADMARATGESGWPGTSILAHEIGHHLSGHTLVPGGSQPPIELEADKFSGFVLFKMGATLAEAEKAIATLIPVADGPTHPGRARRLAAVQAGWQQSCEQQQEQCKPDTVLATAKPGQPDAPTDVPPQSVAPMPAPAASAPGMAAMPDIPGPADIDIPKPGGSGTRVASAPTIDRVPRLSAEATPSKFDRFVYDEVGVFDAAVRAKLQEIAFRFAAAANVEIVTIVAGDLQGRTPDQYALDAMRQLRVGKMEVGNGAVLVVVPGSKQVGVALGPGLLVQYDDVNALKGNLAGFLKVVEGGGRPQSASSLIANASYRIMRDTKSLEWTVRYGSLAQMKAAEDKARAERQKTGAPFNPATDPTFRKLLRVEATLVSRTPDIDDRSLMVNEPRSRHVGPAIHVRTADGRDAVLYVNRSVQTLMPVPLEEGRRYAFVARDTILETGTAQLDLISYDLLD